MRISQDPYARCSRKAPSETVWKIGLLTAEQRSEGDDQNDERDDVGGGQDDAGDDLDD